MATIAQPSTDHKFYLPSNPALAKLVEQAKTAYPSKADGDRIHRAAQLVEAAAVTLHDDGTATVLSNGTSYRLNGAPCTCMDVQRGQAPESRCKHRWAKTLAKKLAQALQETRRFVASVGDGASQQHGILTAWRGAGDFRAWFQPYDATVPAWELSEYEIVYALIVGAPVA